MVRKNYRETFRKGRIIQSWKALNLYNLINYRHQPIVHKTFFQQKWSAKSVARTYHGKQVREKQWQRMFSRRIPAVVDMDVEHLAKNDGSRQAAGRGSGRDDPRWMERRTKQRTPYMSHTFWPLERRLDTAIFRAMFASSVRTARQFVVHGHVKVNGKSIKYPGYLLNPGDMFSVDPELVMLSTGMPNSETKRRYVYNHPPPDAPADFESVKNKKQRLQDKRSKDDTEAESSTVKASAGPVVDATLSKNEVITAKSDPSTETANSKGAAAAAAAAATEALSSPQESEQAAPSSSSPVETDEVLSANKLKSRLKDIDAQITKYLQSPLGKGYVFRTRRAKRVFQLRDLRRQVREAIKTAEDNEANSTATLKPLTNRLARAATSPSPILAHLASHNASKKPDAKVPPQDHLTLLQQWPNARQQDKPYLTPWLPKNWMAAFAFIPRYLEVNQNVCSAVYLRHPVVRAGLSEVPGPFGAEVGLLNYQWYLRRR